MFLLSLRAAGTGLNLTTASYVVLYDPWWNPAVEAQAIDRSHRIGQTQTVNAYRLISPGTVEEKIWELQQSKAQTIADVLGEEGFARSLSKTDLDICSRRIEGVSPWPKALCRMPGPIQGQGGRIALRRRCRLARLACKQRARRQCALNQSEEELLACLDKGLLYKEIEERAYTSATPP